MSIKQTVSSFGISRALSMLEKDPEKNLPKILDMVDKYMGGKKDSFPKQRAMMHKIFSDPEGNWYKYVMDLCKTVDMGVLEKVFTNFFVYENLDGWPKQQSLKEKYGCNIPWAILLDPTSACNLHCTGCWAAEYGNKLNLTLDEIDDIIEQGKELGVYFYIYTGGEPLVRKADIITLCEKHQDCVFLSFTNATLIDEKFADDMLRVKNFIPAISLEGFEEATDGRRGQGVYQKVVKAMEIMRSKRLPYGISACYTSANIDSIGSDAFMDHIIDLGAKFIWFFHYMPIGNDAVPELLPSAEQREWFYHRIRDDFRKNKPIFMMDFQNDGEFVGGCIAGGRRYLHINANGDCDPCVFIHYSDSNIREKSLLEVLQSPLFMAYHDNQPFNENLLRPCPMLENPEAIKMMVEKTGAHSTDPLSPEGVDHLVEKTEPYAEQWTPTADRLWACSHNCAACENNGTEG